MFELNFKSFEPIDGKIKDITWLFDCQFEPHKYMSKIDLNRIDGIINLGLLKQFAEHESWVLLKDEISMNYMYYLYDKGEITLKLKQ